MLWFYLLEFFIGKSIEESKKGKASGWYQAGGLAGNGLGGGAGLWLAEHYNIGIAGMILAVTCVAFSMIVFSINDISYERGKKFLSEIAGLGMDLLSMLKVPVTLYAIILIIMPIGTGAMAGLWLSNGRRLESKCRYCCHDYWIVEWAYKCFGMFSRW